ncbi:tetratricopeptide repeat protein [Thiomicrospira microaerophila]|uniref:hypothetical protein n=1 Tax=Thiomicrospira microaerophila TaxID=406020 RepID=UPI0005CAB814|nr:hypothetical protein [Thiomicrospira microaerophila]
MSLENRFDVLYQLDRFDQLLAETTRALGQNQHDVQAGLYQLLALMHQKAYTDALAASQRLQASCGFSALFWHLTGFVQLQLNQLKEAERSAHHALAISPNGADYQDFLGLVWMHQSNMAGAQAQFIKALETAPLHNQAWLHLAQLYGSVCGRADIARPMIKTYLSREPNDAFALELLADYTQSPWKKQALLAQVLAINPMNQEVSESLRTQGVNRHRFIWLFALLALLALSSHALAEPLAIYAKLSLLAMSIGLSAWLFSWSQRLPAISMFGLLFFIGFAPSEWSLISLFIAGVLTAGASLLSYGVYWVWGKISTTKV